MDMSGLSGMSGLTDISGLSAGGSTQDPSFQPSQEDSGECWLKIEKGGWMCRSPLVSIMTI
jgi:hypothetical protein